MFVKITELPPGCEGVRAEGTVSREDYKLVFEPMLDAAHREGRRIRLLYQLGEDFDTFTPGALFEDTRVGLHHLRLFERCAIVSDNKLMRQSCQLMGALLPYPVRVFVNSEWDEAVSWLSSSTTSSGLTHRLFPDTGVVLVEPHGPLTKEDFEAIALTVDPWIEANGKLHGLVVHPRHFPGWENPGALWGHLRLVRDHHRQVERVALAADGKLAEMAPQIAQHFVKAEVKHFAYDQLDDALAWAAALAHQPA